MKYLIFAIILFFSIQFNSYSNTFVEKSKVNQIKQDTSIVKEKVFYNSDSASNKGINSPKKRKIRSRIFPIGIGIVIIAAIINQKNFELSRVLAVTGLSTMAIGVLPMMKQGAINEAEKVNLLLGMDVQSIKNKYGTNIIYEMKENNGIQYLTFKHIEIRRYQEWNRKTNMLETRRDKYPRNFEFYFDSNGKSNFVRYKYFGFQSLNKKWIESKRI